MYADKRAGVEPYTKAFEQTGTVPLIFHGIQAEIDTTGQERLPDLVLKKNKRSYAGMAGTATQTTRRPDEIDTPDWLANELVNLIEGVPNRLLEPCYGNGSLLKAAARRFPFPDYPTCFYGFEIRDLPSPLNNQTCIGSSDFFEQPPPTAYEQMDVAIMNPPFKDNGVLRFAKHILEKGWLKPGGQLLTIAPAYAINNGDAKLRWLSSYLYAVYPVSYKAFSPIVPTLHTWILDLRINAADSPGRKTKCFIK